MSPSQNRERMLDTAVRLFNERGTASVSTNHIAEAAGISPGNLYYHFRNKEEIIRAILERMYASWGETWDSPADQKPGIEDLVELVRQNFELLWQYRFFYREAVALLMRDPDLAERHAQMQSSRLELHIRVYRQYVASGVMKEPGDPDTIPDLAATAWILATNWLTFLEAGGRPVDKSAMDVGERLIFRVFAPYLSEDARDRLEHTRKFT